MLAISTQFSWLYSELLKLVDKSKTNKYQQEGLSTGGQACHIVGFDILGNCSE